MNRFLSLLYGNILFETNCPVAVLVALPAFQFSYLWYIMWPATGKMLFLKI
jgi:hypothetical protein